MRGWPWIVAAIAAGCTSKTAAPVEEPAPAQETAAAAPEGAAPAPTDPGDRPPVATSFEMNDGQLVLPGPIEFVGDSDRIAPESDPALWHAVDYLAAKSAITTLRIEGHTSNDGSPDANLALSGKRALAVARWLVTHGVACQRLLPVGFGGDKPIAPNDTPENKARNRRIALVNAALAGRPIGGMPLEGGGLIAGDPCQ